MRNRKMSEQELRMWCIEKSINSGFSSKDYADWIYEYITQKEQRESQKKPHECIFCRLSSWFHGLLKQL